MNNDMALLIVGVSLIAILFGGALINHLDWLIRKTLRERRMRRRMGMLQ